MNAILDIIIVVIAVLTVYFAVKNGFVKTLLSASSFLLAVIITVLLLSPVKTAFMKTTAAADLRERVESSIDQILVNNGIEDVEALIDSESKHSDIALLLDKVGINEDELSLQFDQWKTEAGADLRERLIDYIAEPVVNAFVTVSAVALLFFGSIILLKIAAYVLDKLFKLPILKTANKLFGLLLGIILAIVRIYLFCLMIKLLLPYGQALGVSMISSINPEGTLLFRLFYNLNIFDFLL